jgi:hypothetical protein
MEEKCDFEKWVESVSQLLLEQRHGAAIVMLVHSSPGAVEMITNIPDASFTLGVLRVGTLALENNVVGKMMVVSDVVQSQDLANKFETDKTKVHSCPQQL